eukprot:Gb_06516 [translate_table: standard]
MCHYPQFQHLRNHTVPNQTSSGLMIQGMPMSAMGMSLDKVPMLQLDILSLFLRCSIHNRLLLLLQVVTLIVSSSQRIGHKSHECSHHGYKPTKRKLSPWIIIQAGICKRFKSIRKNMDKPRCKYDTRGKSLDHKENISVWL